MRSSTSTHMCACVVGTAAPNCSGSVRTVTTGIRSWRNGSHRRRTWPTLKPDALRSQQGADHPLDLRVRVFKRSVGPNDIVGPGGLLVRTHLSCEPLAGFVAAQASRHQSRFLRLDPTERGNDLIEVASMSRLEQEWNVDNREPSATGELEAS